MSSIEEFSDVLNQWVKIFMRRTGQEFKHFMDDSGLSFSQVNTIMRLHFSGQADISEHRTGRPVRVCRGVAVSD